MDRNRLNAAYKLNNKMLRAISHFYEILTPSISEEKRIGDLANWYKLSEHTIKRNAEKVQYLRPKFDDSNEEDVDFLDMIQEYAAPKMLWESLNIVCRYCEKGKKDCPKGITATKTCTFCNYCENRAYCEVQHEYGNIPPSCKLLEELCRYINEVKLLAYIFFPLKYVLHLKEGLAQETLDEFSEILEEFLGQAFNIEYISCVIRFAHMYDLRDAVSFSQLSEQSAPKKVSFEDPTTWFEYSIHSLSISRGYKKEILEKMLKQIPSDPIDDAQFETWKKCDTFKKELMRAQKSLKHGSVTTLLEYVKSNVSVYDIIRFCKHFADIAILPLRPIDISVLQRCLCWKDYSFEKFWGKLMLL